MRRHFMARWSGNRLVTESTLRADVMRPSALGVGEITLWHQMLASRCSLQRAFFTPTFAQACERATGRAYVAVLYDGGGVRGFLPFQFASTWHERLRLAERIGGALSDAAGLVAWPDVRISAAALLRLARLGSMVITHLMEDQELFDLDATWSDIGFVTDVEAGSDSFFAAMGERSRDFVRDTERRLRRAQRRFGSLDTVRLDRIPGVLIAEVIAQKRAQYKRTQVEDPFDRHDNMRLISALNEAPAPDCRLTLTRLEADGQAIAQHLGPQYRDVLSYWFPVYDPEVRDISPGRLLLWQIIRRAPHDGVKLIDRGVGDAPYKREFATRMTRYGRAFWHAGTVRSLMARSWQSVQWRLRGPPRSKAEPS
jgi:CelD/BcsL family acetyltransferase involved in cellulose biosynthesis